MTRVTELFLAALLTAAAQAQTTVTKAPFGNLPDGSVADLYTLKDAALTVRVTTWGAHLTDIIMTSADSPGADVILGYSSLDGYLADDGKTYMGAVVGRYGNRIGGAKFTLDGHTCDLSRNEPTDTLHGGKVGFDRHNWTARQMPNGVEMTLLSPDGDMGFPGAVTAHVRYTLTGDKLRLDYSATTDKPTVINLTNHAYFNLAGTGDMLSHTLLLRASRYTPVDRNLIPTGQLAPVAGTPFDFTHGHPIGDRIHDLSDPQMKIGNGYDHNWCLDNPGSLTTPAAILRDPSSGRTLTIFTTEPGIQFYSGNKLDHDGRNGEHYSTYGGIALETQHFPDSPNKPGFRSTTLLPGRPYTSITILQFDVTGIQPTKK